MHNGDYKQQPDEHLGSQRLDQRHHDMDRIEKAAEERQIELSLVRLQDWTAAAAAAAAAAVASVDSTAAAALAAAIADSTGVAVQYLLQHHSMVQLRCVEVQQRRSHSWRRQLEKDRMRVAAEQDQLVVVAGRRLTAAHLEAAHQEHRMDNCVSSPVLHCQLSYAMTGMAETANGNVTYSSEQ